MYVPSLIIIYITHYSVLFKGTFLIGKVINLICIKLVKFWIPKILRMFVNLIFPKFYILIDKC